MRGRERQFCEACGDKLVASHGPDSSFACPRCRPDDGPTVGADTERRVTPANSLDTSAIPAPRPNPEELTEALVPGVASPSRVSTAAHDSTVAAISIGRFVVRQVLGQGAFGTVYRAYDPLLDREIALKVPRFADDNRSTRERFLREAKAAARLRHPNLVAVFESGEVDGQPYIASEFVDGTPLSRVLARVEPRDLRRGIEWVRQIAEALHYAHGEGVIHRDVKPANIMINAAGRPQVMDFGLAKRDTDEAAQMTLEGTILGTPTYMAPEQARGELSKVGPASDQYSVGVLLYVILSGKLPYSGDAWSVMKRVGDFAAAPPRPRAIHQDVPADLEACCLKAMDKSISGRYADLGAFAHDLQRWLEGRSVKARRIGPGEQFRRWCRRNPLIASLAGSLSLLLLAAAITGYVLAFQFQSLADSARQETAKAVEARARETLSRRDLERLLVDNYTENGLTAAQRQDDRQSVLWFGRAAVLATSFPERREHNLVRSSAWLARTAIPAYAFRADGYWRKALRFHPSGRYLLVESLAWECEIHDLWEQRRLSLPHQGPIQSALWRPDGSTLWLASEGNLVEYDFPALQATRQWSHPEAIACLAGDSQGKRLAVGSGGGFAVYDTTEPQPTAVLTPLESRVHSLQFSADGELLAVATDDWELRTYRWSAAARRWEPCLPVQELAVEGQELLYGFAAANRLVVVDNGKAIRCWDTGQAAVAWERPVGRVICLAIAPHGERVAWELLESSYEHSAQARDAATGEPFGAKIVHENHIYDLDWHPDGRTLLSASGDQSAAVTDIETGQALVAHVPHNDFVSRGVWSPDGRAFATSHWGDPLVRVWKMPRATNRVDTADGTNDGTNDGDIGVASEQGFAKFAPGYDTMIFAGFDTRRTQRTMQAHDPNSGEPLGPVIPFPGMVHDAACLSQRGLLVAGGSSEPVQDELAVTRRKFAAEGRLLFWNYRTGVPVHTEIITPTEPVAVVGSPDESDAVVLCDGGELLLVDAGTGQVRVRETAYTEGFADKGFVIRDRIRFAPDGREFAVWGFGSEIQLRDAATGKLRRTFRHRREDSYVHDVRFSPASRELIACLSDNVVLGWDRDTGDATATLPHTGWVFQAQFDRAGTRLLTASSDRQARVWDWQRKTLLASTNAQADQVFAVSFAPRETMFITGARDGTVTAWETTTGKQVAPARRFGDMVYQVVVDPRSDTLFVAGRLDRVARVSLHDWFTPYDLELPDDELMNLAEIVSNQKVLDTSVAAALTSDEWFQRWHEFRAARPDFPLFQLRP